MIAVGVSSTKECQYCGLSFRGSREVRHRRILNQTTRSKSLGGGTRTPKDRIMLAHAVKLTKTPSLTPEQDVIELWDA